MPAAVMVTVEPLMLTPSPSQLALSPLSRIVTASDSSYAPERSRLENASPEAAVSVAVSALSAVVKASRLSTDWEIAVGETASFDAVETTDCVAQPVKSSAADRARGRNFVYLHFMVKDSFQIWDSGYSIVHRTKTIPEKLQRNLRKTYEKKGL